MYPNCCVQKNHILYFVLQVKNWEQLKVKWVGFRTEIGWEFIMHISVILFTSHQRIAVVNKHQTWYDDESRLVSSWERYQRL